MSDWVLAISLSPATLGVALLDHAGNGLLSGTGDFHCRVEPGPDHHSKKLMPAIDALLTSCAVPASDLSAIAFDAGPGGFTRVRVACAVTQGMALGLGIPVAAVESLQALAWACAMQTGLASAAQVAVAIDARMSECYVGRYQYSPDETIPIQVLNPAAQLPMGELEEWLGRASGQADSLLCSDTIALFGNEETRKGNHGHVQIPAQLHAADPPAARYVLEAVARLAGSPLAPLQPPEKAHPLYVRDKVALTVREQAGLRAAKQGSPKQ